MKIIYKNMKKKCEKPEKSAPGPGPLNRCVLASFQKAVTEECNWHLFWPFWRFQRF